MKKIIWSLIVFAFAPLSALAVDYDIEHYYIDASIKENGDMDVQELIVLDGSFNGYERDILYSKTSSLYNASGIENVSINAKKYTNKVSFDTFEEDFEPFTNVASAENGESNKYIVSKINGGYRYRMYYKTSRSSTAFLIRYTLKDVAILHNDCAEVYWNFIGDDFEDPINDLNIRVNLPKKEDKKKFNL